MLLQPIKLTLYDPKSHEKIAEYEQNLITFDMLFRAAALSEVLNVPKKKRKWWMWWEPDLTPEQEQINALLRLVVDFFGGQFTIEQLRNGADVAEVMAVMQAIIGRSRGIAAENPTFPRKARERHKNQKKVIGS